MDKKEEVEIGSPVTVRGTTLIPVIRFSLNSWHHKGGVSFLGMKQPVNVVVISPWKKKAFRITGEEIALQQLLQEVPEAEEIIQGTVPGK